jgi:hypothetical protein
VSAFENIIVASYTREERHAIGVLADDLILEARAQHERRRWWGRRLSGREPPMEPDDVEDR